jgi:hypothetical protein
VADTAVALDFTMRPLLAMLLVSLASCGGVLAEGKSEFNKGRYPEAKQTLASLETDSRAWNDAKRAEYALYRGLTLSALGDRAQGDVWLREAKAIEDVHPGSLSREDGQRLKVGLDTGDVQ